MSAHSDVTLWAVGLLRERVAEFEKARRKARKDWKNGKRLHNVRTGARRLRAWVEDLHECLAEPEPLLERCKTLGDETTQARDAQVTLARLQRYRRFAMPAERAEIDALCADVKTERRHGMKAAKAAVKACKMELLP